MCKIMKTFRELLIEAPVKKAKRAIEDIEADK